MFFVIYIIRDYLFFVNRMSKIHELSLKLKSKKS